MVKPLHKHNQFLPKQTNRDVDRPFFCFANLDLDEHEGDFKFFITEAIQALLAGV